MGGIKSFFGGSKKEEPKVEERSTLAPWQQELTGLVGPYFGGAISPGEAYPGQLPGTTPLTSYEQLSLEGLETLFGGEGLMAQVQSATAEALEPTGFEDYYETKVKRPALEEFREEILPGITRRHAPQFWGTERVRAEEAAYEDLIESLVGARAELAFGTEEAAKGRALSALGLMPGVTEAYRTFAQVGALPRMVEEAGLQAEYNEWLRRQQEMHDEYAELMAALGISTTQFISVPGTSATTGFLGAMAPGLGMALGARYLPSPSGQPLPTG